MISFNCNPLGFVRLFGVNLQHEYRFELFLHHYGQAIPARFLYHDHASVSLLQKNA